MEMLANRLAKIQVSAIGYPPTTGLSSIDYKVVDEVAAPLGTEHYYSERLLRLPETFWCFDPGEPYVTPSPPPRLEKGHITFGCYGNISKISEEMLSAWRSILVLVPSSRLIVRGITFEDPEARERIRTRLEKAGLDLNCIDLLPPTRPELFASAFADVDIILDTFPFNGGTTSCHALWNGVPVVTLAGEILLSRMGASMLSALGLPHLVARSFSEYVEIAGSLAMDSHQLDELRGSLRARMRDSALGNGKKFASHFESACLSALNNDAIGGGRKDRDSTVPWTIPEEEAIRRAFVVLDSGNRSSAERVIDYLCRHYPQSPAGKLLRAWILENNGSLEAAHQLVLDAISGVAGDTRLGAVSQLIRLEIGMKQFCSAEERAETELLKDISPTQRLLLSSYGALARAMQGKPFPARTSERSDRNSCARITVIICSVDKARFERTQRSLNRALGQDNYQLVCISDATSLSEAYNRGIGKASGEVLIFCHDDVEIAGAEFRRSLDDALTTCDIIGVAGATKVTGPTWWHAGIDCARGAVVMPSPEHGKPLCLSVYGGIGTPISQGVACIDGLFMAVKREVLDRLRFDESTFDGFHLYDLDFSFEAAKAGFHIGVVPKLGLLHHSRGTYDKNWLGYARLFCEKQNLPWEPTFSSPTWGAGLPLPELNYLPQILDQLFSTGS
jgi:hypothetical protein